MKNPSSSSRTASARADDKRRDASPLSAPVTLLRYTQSAQSMSHNAPHGKRERQNLKPIPQRAILRREVLRLDGTRPSFAPAPTLEFPSGNLLGFGAVSNTH